MFRLLPDAAPIVTLKVYDKLVSIQTVMVGPSQQTRVTTRVSLAKSIDIAALTGGAKATCTMVANANSLFIGTSASTAVVQLDKTKFTSHTIGHGHLHGITANEDGYVIVTFGGRNPVERTFGPDGEEMGLGGIAAPPTLPNQTIGVPLN